jgi:membrane associated rhomboid family serine protease
MIVTELEMELATCSRCGRLLGDESGDVCDHCDPTLRPSSTPPKPIFLLRAPATWTLITITILASWTAFAFWEKGHLPGSAFGPAILHGHWWLLITELFIHVNAGHLIGNLFFLWIFGKRVERILGPKTFIAFYLTCGLAGGMMRLILDPETYYFGASGAVFGLAGALLSIYGIKFKTLSGKQWLKYLLLLIFTALSLYGGFTDPLIGNIASVDNIVHVTGLSAGILLGAIIAMRFGWDRRAKGILFAGAGVLLLGMAIWARVQNARLPDPDSGASNNALGRP